MNPRPMRELRRDTNGVYRPLDHRPPAAPAAASRPRTAAQRPAEWHFRGGRVTPPMRPIRPRTVRWERVAVVAAASLGPCALIGWLVWELVQAVSAAVSWVAAHGYQIAGVLVAVAFLGALTGGSGARTFSGTFRGRIH